MTVCLIVDHSSWIQKVARRIQKDRTKILEASSSEETLKACEA